VNSCPHCDAPLKPASTFCLACDRPVVDESSRLSVGEPMRVSAGRPLVGLLVVAGVVLAVGGAAYGGLAYIHQQRTKSTDAVLEDVTRGTTLLVDAEGGRADACQRATSEVAGPADDVLRECRAIVDHDPGVRVAAIRVDRLDLEGAKGTARVRATISDAHGTHALDRAVDLVRGRRDWRMTWDGRPVA